MMGKYICSQEEKMRLTKQTLLMPSKEIEGR